MEKLITYKQYVKGLQTEIKKWGYVKENAIDEFELTNYNPIWNYYIIILRKNIPYSFSKLLLPIKKYKIADKTRYTYNGYKLDKYFDMHGGITFYEPIKNKLDNVMGVKIGCDYAHHGDMPNLENYYTILADLENSVNRFIECFPNYRVWCQGNGKYYKPIKENGILEKLKPFKSFKYFKDLKEE